MNPWNILGNIDLITAAVNDPNIDLIPGVTSSPQNAEIRAVQQQDPKAEKYRAGGKIYNFAGDVIGTYEGDAAPTAATVSPEQIAAQRAAAAEAQRMSRINNLRGEVKGKAGDIAAAYESLFGDVENLAKARAGEIETTAGENINKLTEQYTAAIPKIRSSYAAIGAADSTDTRDANLGAKAGFEESTKTVGKEKQANLTKVANYVNENKANWMADRDSIMRLIDRVDQVEDEGELSEARNAVEDKLGTARATRATLMTDEGARGELSKLTADGGRFESIKGSLDKVINSNLSGGVKAAAVEAVANSAGLSEEDRMKVKEMYGDVYNAQA